MANFPKRYNLETICGDGDCGMEEESCGEWVKFADIKDLLQATHNRQSVPSCSRCGKIYPLVCTSCQAEDIVRITR